MFEQIEYEPEYNPRGKDTAKKLKDKGIESPKGKYKKINNRTWILEKK
jgi:hypothetical protein